MTDQVAVNCADTVVIERERADGTWVRVETAEGSSTFESRGIASVRIVAQCEGMTGCRTTDGENRVRYRLLVEGDTSSPSTLLVSSRRINLSITPEPETGRRGLRLVWSTDELTCVIPDVTVTDLSSGASSTLAAVIEEGRTSVVVPPEFSDRIEICVLCPSNCAAATARFDVGEVDERPHIAPNPIVLSSAGDIDATIAVWVTQPSNVEAQIVDDGRSIVRIFDARSVDRRGPVRLSWDGRDDSGRIVSAGTYVCVIFRGSEPPLYLPFVVVD